MCGIVVRIAAGEVCCATLWYLVLLIEYYVHCYRDKMVLHCNMCLRVRLKLIMDYLVRKV